MLSCSDLENGTLEGGSVRKDCVSVAGSLTLASDILMICFLNAKLDAEV